MRGNDLWDALGSLDDEQATQILTHLFVRYEQLQSRCPDDPVAASFFQTLAAVMEQVQSCNVSRR